MYIVSPGQIGYLISVNPYWTGLSGWNACQTDIFGPFLCIGVMFACFQIRDNLDAQSD